MSSNDLTHIYYFSIDSKGNEMGEGILIDLNGDGSANVSRLPHDLQETLQKFGVPNEMRTSVLFPKDGTHFLSALLHSSNGYRRFRLTSTKSSRV